MEKCHYLRCQKFHKQSVIGVDGEEQFSRLGRAIDAVEVAELFNLFRRAADIVATDLAEKELPLLKESLSFRVCRYGDGFVKSADTLMSKACIRTRAKVTR